MSNHSQNMLETIEIETTSTMSHLDKIVQKISKGEMSL